jgi:hypothetical protein
MMKTRPLLTYFSLEVVRSAPTHTPLARVEACSHLVQRVLGNVVQLCAQVLEELGLGRHRQSLLCLLS